MSRFHSQRGFTLVELMIAMLLGLVVVGGAISVLISNKNSYRTNEGVSQIQESARTAFELLARDIRQTGGTGCDNARRMANVLGSTATWWQSWASVRGFDGAQADTAVAFSATTGERVNGTDSLQLRSIDGSGFPVDVHAAGAGTMRINNAGLGSLAASDIMVVCDFDHSAMFQASLYDGPTSTLSYGLAGSPGNCSTGLGFPTNCDGGTGNVYTFARNSWVGRLFAVDWYIGNNGRAADGGRSLYRRRLSPGGVVLTEEVISGVTDMQIRYGRNGNDNVVDATGVVGATAWAAVNSVFITVTVTSTDSRVSTSSAVNTGRLQRTFTYVVTLRNRVP